MFPLRQIGVGPGGRTVVRHGGGMMGVNTSLLLVPASGLAIVVLANQQGPTAGTLAEQCLAALLPDPERPPPPPPARLPQVPRPLQPPRPPLGVVTAPELVGRWAGEIERYGLPGLPLQLVVDEAGGATAWIDAEPPAPLLGAAFTAGMLTGARADRRRRNCTVQICD